jgi:hypothetical protein
MEPFQAYRLVVRDPERVADLHHGREPVAKRFALAESVVFRMELQEAFVSGNASLMPDLHLLM